MRASFSTGLGFTGSSLPAGGGDGSGLFALMGDRGLRGGDFYNVQHKPDRWSG